MRILGIGNPFLDRTLHIDEAPKGLTKGGTTVVFEKEKVEDLWREYHKEENFNWSLGGSCANVLKALPSLGCLSKDSSFALLGMAGKDKKHEIEEKLKGVGVESHLVEGKSDNGIVNCFVTPDCERTMQAYFGASMELSKEHILPEHFKDVSHVHLEGYLAYFKDVLETSTKAAKENGSTISLDLSSIDVIDHCSDQLKQCAAAVDMVFGNFDEMKKLTSTDEAKSIFEFFQKEQIVVITNGSKGGWYKAKDEDEFMTFEAVKTDEVLDTTGAGDFFIAGFLGSFLATKDIQLSIKVANLAASYIIQQDGTDLSGQKWEELKKNIEILSEDKSGKRLNKEGDVCQQLLL